MKKQALRFRKYVKSELESGYLVALIDLTGKIVSTDCAADIDELDEFNDWRINGSGEILRPCKLKGYGLTIHSGHIAESTGFNGKYTTAEFNKFLTDL